jgi:hypothetical protein
MKWECNKCAEDFSKRMPCIVEIIEGPEYEIEPEYCPFCPANNPEWKVINA